MTPTTPAPTAEEVLGEYEGYPVLGTKIIVNKLGGNLSEAVEIAPLVIDAEGFGYLAVKVQPTKHRYEFERNDDDKIVGVWLVQIFDAVGAMFIDETKVGRPLDKTIEKVATLRREKKTKAKEFEFADPDLVQGGAADGMDRKPGPHDAPLGDLPRQVDDVFAGGDAA